MRYFNIAGPCFPEEHYMVDLAARVREIALMVERGDYFCINCGRQYGKTTTLDALRRHLSSGYTVFSISFEGVGDLAFRDEQAFCAMFLEMLKDQADNGCVPGISAALRECLGCALARPEGLTMAALGRIIHEMCESSSSPLVLIVDEVDQAAGFDVFLDFLGVLRARYQQRRLMKTFQTVILAGVYNIRNLKTKIRNGSGHQYNSPWNIAVDFTIGMAFTEGELAGMLESYESEHNTGMDIPQMAGLLSEYTGGYPFLVSRLCKLMDENLPTSGRFASPSGCWTKAGFLAAVKALLKEQNTLFDDLIKKVEDNPELGEMLSLMLCDGRSIPYQPDDYAQDIGLMFNFVRETDGHLEVANRIFETRLYNYFAWKRRADAPGFFWAGNSEKGLFVSNGRLDMQVVLERFVRHYGDIFGAHPSRLLEEDARQCFLLFLLPIINGTGHYYVEARTRNERRMDIVVDYAGEQSIIELKIWRGQMYIDQGMEQLRGYLDAMHESKGYLVIFNFNEKKAPGVSVVRAGDKTVVVAMV